MVCFGERSNLQWLLLRVVLSLNIVQIILDFAEVGSYSIALPFLNV